MATKSRGTDEPEAVGSHDAGTETTTHLTGFDRVLVAIDGESDDAVGAVAVAEAARHDARVDALSIVRMNASVDQWDVVVERREERAEAALDAVDHAATEPGVPISKRLRYGDPAREIVRYAAHNGIDLIVMGEPTRTGLRRYFSRTSVTDRVRRTASVPVLTVPVDD
ncbi:universal stress protein [Natrinema salsiterrestre]|uniref:Universal stress protein n=1 Tax=Natrinema salsiterrestre TaxID=2950540 RepID=A0A9Q4Q0L6_9EURY|nr:universal stress protein [Natrinema salsiterrestre]MDF9746700.1 universal stress protein [Natrinema salsiterrestre]